MAFDPHANFATSLVATAPSPASSGTSLVVTGGEGSRFPATPFNAIVGPANTLLTPANAEIVRVTGRSTDTFTVTRTQEGSSARSILVGDQVYCGPTSKTFTDLEVVDAAAGTGSLRTLGSGSQQAAAGNDSRLPQLAVLTADMTAISAQTTPQNISGLPLAISSSNTEIWRVTWWIVFHAQNATMDFRWVLSVPTGCTAIGGSTTSGIGGWQLPVTATSATAMAGQASIIAAGSANATTGVQIVYIVFGGGTAGNVILQYAQNTSDPGTLQILKGSAMEATKLAA